MSFTHAIAAGGRWEHLAESCIDQLGDTKSASLGLIYLSPPLAPHIDAIAGLLTARTGIARWVGAVGYGVCATGIEHYEEPALGALVCDLPADAWRLLPPLADGAASLPDELTSWSAGQTQRLAIVHADPRAPDLPDLIGRLAQASEAFLVGALTADAPGAAQIAGDGAVAGPVSGVVFGNAASFATGVTQGCSPIGPAHEVTLADGTIVAELDGAPALEVLRRELGRSFDGDWQKFAGVIFAGLVVRGSDTGDYLVRGIHGIDPQRGLVQIGAETDTGSKLMFVRRDAHSALADLEHMLDRLAARLDGPPKAGVYHNCIGRGRNQFGPGSEELSMIEERLGTFPLVGMFGNGEISCDRLYTYTGVLTLFT